MRRSIGKVAVAVAVLVGVLSPAHPSIAAEPALPAFSMTPTVTAANGSVALKSVDPCPEPYEAGDVIGIRAWIVTWRGRGFWTSSRAVNADRSWGWTMVLPASMLRNGRYIVTISCEEYYGPQATEGDPYFTYAPVELDITSAQGQPDPVVRLAGKDRIETAIATSRDVIDAGKSSVAVLARADSYADSLAGAPVAAAYGAPLLLSAGDVLDPRTSQELTRVFGASTSRVVVILGGTTAISQHVEDQLKDLGYRVIRIGGLNRFATAARIAATGPAAEIGVAKILVADGTDFHDGLIAGATAGNGVINTSGATVVLLTDGSRMPDETASFIQSHAKVPRYAIGRPAVGADPAAKPLFGSDPTQTALIVAREFYPGPRLVGFATTGSFADALAGGLHAALTGAVLLYTTPGSLPPAVDSYLSQQRPNLVGGFVYGGTSAVSESVRQAVVSRISG